MASSPSDSLFGSPPTTPTKKTRTKGRVLKRWDRKQLPTVLYPL